MSREMIDSNAGWIGSIPSEWSAYKLLYALERPIFDGPHETPTVVDNGVPFISVDSVNDTKNVDLNVCKKFISEEDFNEYYKKTPLKQGDVLFTKAATIGKTAIVDDRKYMVWSPLAILRSGKHVNNEYLYYVLNCPNLIDYTAHFLGNSATQINVGMRELERAKLPVPPLSEQRQIVHFLDRKCSAIDTAIEKTKGSIEKLEEYKKAVITKAVTKGLNPDAKMKDSGIEWIGEVPETWDVKRIKYACLERKEKKIFKDAPNRYIGLENVESYTGHFIETESTYLPGVYDVCYENDILFGKLRPYLAKVIMAPYEAACTGEFLIIKNFVGEIKFLFYWLANKEFVKAVDVSTYGAKMPRANTEYIMNLPICLPSDKEQQQILSYLDDKCASIDVLISKKQDAINKWEEYKKSLIYYAVTGKIDCRNEAVK